MLNPGTSLGGVLITPVSLESQEQLLVERKRPRSGPQLYNLEENVYEQEHMDRQMDCSH